MNRNLDPVAALRKHVARGAVSALFVLGACSGNGTSSLGHDNTAAEAGHGAVAGSSGGPGENGSTGGDGAETGGTSSAGAPDATQSGSANGNAGAGAHEDSGGSLNGSGGAHSAGADDSTGGTTAAGGRKDSGGSDTGGAKATGGTTASGGTNASGGKVGSGGSDTGGSAATGGTTGSGGSASGGTGGGTTYTCDGASCCAPTNLRADSIWVEQTRVKMIVERADDDESYWEPTADVAVAGAEATCTSSATSLERVVLSCNLLPGLDPWLACDSTVALQISLRSSTYADYEATSPLCSASGSTDIELEKPVLCPLCPTDIEVHGATPCDIPDRICQNPLAPDGRCTCTMDYRTGDLTWVCPIP